MRSVAAFILAGLLVSLSGCDKQPPGLLDKSRIVLLCQHPGSAVKIPEGLAENAGSVDVLAPMWFDLKDDGRVVPIQPGGDYASCRKFCRDHHIALLPLLRNFKPRPFLLNPAAVERSLGEMAGLVDRLELDGLTVDLEEDGSNPATQRPMLDLLQKLHAQLNARHKFLFVTFNTGTWGRGWQSPAMLDSCDLAFAMFYDYSGPWDKAHVNSTAPYDWPGHSRDVRRDVQKILDPKVAHKFLFGIPTYGNDFAIDSSGRCVSVDVRYVNPILATLAAEQATPRWDEQARTPYFEYQKDGLSHRVWYEDAKSYAWRMQLAADAGCAGIGVWSVGSRDGVDPAFWAALAAYHQGR
ncbi:hypothetical protein BH09VER1_BH09VER1_16920 [soil metagenome]